ncbi:membrane protein [Mycobacterium botniense]|uniref:Membrane protein n=2 Tax=Mycobacterium botniense TaxID=84962 RepID=A0A7I9XV50_9MYCO|nr:membrane protein [Mycobacterium botniense]
MLTRRAALRLGMGAVAGATGVWALSALLDPTGPQASPTAPFEPAAGSAVPTTLSGSFVSAARGGVTTNWVIVRPPGQTAALRPVIALHGKGGNANTVLDLGVDQELAKLVQAGHPGFAVVGVDGGDTYWHRRVSGQDSGAMVLEELLPLLAAKGLDTSRVAFMGWSMGGYGALLLGARLGAARTAGICAVSPALFTSYTGSAPGAFDSYEDWERNNVFGLPALASIPLRVDCGTSDRFYPATRAFVAQLRTPPAGGFSPGGHDVSFWRQQLPAELAWMVS